MLLLIVIRVSSAVFRPFVPGAERSSQFFLGGTAETDRSSESCILNGSMLTVLWDLPFKHVLIPQKRGIAFHA